MQPLEGIRVLDMTRVLAGPFCTMALGDLGAEVLKIEEPGKGDDTRQFGPPFVSGVSTYYLAVNRNKKSVAVNLKSAQGRELVQRLARSSDVLVENFRPGVAGRLGLGAEALRAQNPRLVYCSISGFGHRGVAPYTGMPGYDVVAQGLSGFQYLTGDPSGPPMRAGVPIADTLAGMTALQGILLALYARERTGRGQVVDISILDSTVQVLSFLAAGFLTAGKVPNRIGNHHPSIAPFDTFRAKDGYLNVGAGTDAQFKKFCEVLGEPALAEDPRFAENRLRVQNRQALLERVEPIFARRTAAEWMEAFDGVGVTAGPIQDVPAALAHPQLAARGMIARLQHPETGDVKVLGTPLRLEGVDPSKWTAPPAIGQHTREVLSGVLGMKTPEIDALIAAGAVSVAS